MKKVGIITQHQVFNYGSVLQAYATQEIFKKKDCNVEIINYISERWSNKKIFWDIEKEGNKIFVICYKILRFPIVLQRKLQFKRFTEKRLNLTKKYKTYKDLKKSPPNMDYYIVGSDQCWNNFYNGIDLAYFLQFGDQNIKRNSFATSIGVDQYNNEDSELIREYVSDFDNISVREQKSSKLIEDISNKKVVSIIDPTLQVNKEFWEKISNKKRLIKDKYLLLFVLYDEDLNASKYAREIADNLNLKVVELSWQIKKKQGVDILMSHRTPEEFLALIRDASFIVTNSFHGLAFAINYNKEFIVVERSKFNDRIANLLNIIELKNRNFNKDNFDLKYIESKIDYKKVNDFLELERKKADKFVEKILE